MPKKTAISRKKQPTRAELRKEASIEALKLRLIDIAHGAYGAYLPLNYESEEIGGLAAEMGLDGFARWLGGIKNALLAGRDEKALDLTEIRFLDRYDSIQSAAEFLHEHGVQADA